MKVQIKLFYTKLIELGALQAGGWGVKSRIQVKEITSRTDTIQGIANNGVGMKDVEYKILFGGQLLPGFEEQAVRKDFSTLFEADEPQIERLFSGQTSVIKKSTTATEARKFEQILARIGARCAIVSVDDGVTLPPCFDVDPLGTRQEMDRTDKLTRRTPRFFRRIGRVKFLALSWLVLLIEAIARFSPTYAPAALGVTMTIQETALMVMGTHMAALLLMTYLTVTRLHDVNRSGWLWFFVLIPFVNLLLLLWLSLVPGTQGDNRFGAPPSSPGQLSRAIGVYMPLALIVLALAAGYLYQDQLIALILDFKSRLTI